jgi:hypothetical protein
MTKSYPQDTQPLADLAAELRASRETRSPRTAWVESARQALIIGQEVVPSTSLPPWFGLAAAPFGVAFAALLLLVLMETPRQPAGIIGRYPIPAETAAWMPPDRSDLLPAAPVAHGKPTAALPSPLRFSLFPADDIRRLVEKSRAL